MKKKAFRHPKDMPKNEERTPISTRVTVSTKKALEKAATKHSMSLASLTATILEDYAYWLKSNNK